MNVFTWPVMKLRFLLLNSSQFVAIIALLGVPCLAQEASEQANISSSISKDGTRTIIVEASGQLPEPPLFFTARAQASAQVGLEQIEQAIQLNVTVIQGKASTLSFGLNGEGKVTEVKGKSLRSWSIRQEDSGGQENSARFLELHLDENVTELEAVIKIRSTPYQLPSTIDVTHLTPGEAVALDSIVSLAYSSGVSGSVTSVKGFSPLTSGKDGLLDRTESFQTTTGGQIKLSLKRDGAVPGPVELVDTSLKGEVQPSGKSVKFQLRCTARVTEANAEITILSGHAAVSQLPSDPNYRLKLSTTDEHAVYTLVFAEPGEFPVALDFVAAVISSETNARGMDFTIATSAIVPLSLIGLAADLEFHRDQESVVPQRDGDAWVGYLSATGRAKLSWKAARQTGEGRLFFSTTAQVETKVGTGLLRQDHQIDYQVLQGELKTLNMMLNGPGEILDVQGPNMVAWKVTSKGEQRQLEITLSQPITATSQFKVRSQTPVGSFPARVEGLRLNPIGSIRHSGYLRIENLGLVRLEPTSLGGLTQLAPDQFPGAASEARQVFVYRFPAGEHTFTIAADRIQPEVNISELVLYRLAETDRVIQADVELDIREAPIREWDFLVPSDYSVVAVTGASVADYVAASETMAGQRNLKVVFSDDVAGRQLVSLLLEKSEATVAGDWVLPRIEYPSAKTVRGDIGIIGAPGFRIAIGETSLLAEKPLSYFPKPSPDLQQAFRIREPGWSATMQIELLDRSIQSDVFHLYSLSEETVYGSALINYFVTGSPVAEWKISVPEGLDNVMVDGQDVRTWRREGDTLIVSLHQPVMGAYTLLLTFEEKPDKSKATFQAGQVAPVGVQGERGYIQVVSPMQVEISTESVSQEMLQLDPLELPAEFRLLSTAPALGTWQYTERPFDLILRVNWFEPGTTVTQVIEFSEANSRVSQDGELVTDVLYFVKSRGQRTLKVKLPPAPVRLWEVSVNGQPVTARQADDAILIPLPGGTDPNEPVQVSLRLGKPTVSESSPELTLPIVFAPVLKTQWNIVSDENHVLVPTGGTVTPATPVTRPTGFDWVTKRAVFQLVVIGMFTALGVWCQTQADYVRALGLISFIVAIVACLSTASLALSQVGPPLPLQLSVPILAAGDTIELQVNSTPLWRVNLSWIGLALLLVGIVSIVGSCVKKFRIQKPAFRQVLIRSVGAFLVALGVLLQGDGAAWFFCLLASAIIMMLFLPSATNWIRRLDAERRAKQEAGETKAGESLGPVASTLVLIALALSSASTSNAAAPDGFMAADSIVQDWQVTHEDARLVASGTVTVSGRPGDRFLLLRSPAVLTRFEGEGVRLTKTAIDGEGLSYVLTIPFADDDEAPDGSSNPRATTTQFAATFAYQLESLTPMQGVPVLTGSASVQEITFHYDEPGWDVQSEMAVAVRPGDSESSTQSKLLLGPGRASLILKPKTRDISAETTQFFVEATNLYLPGPGVVDGRHRIEVRPSQGLVSSLNLLVPQGIAVSSVNGPIGSWQFDADSGRLKLQVEPTQSQTFTVTIETQRSLDPLPAEVTLAPLQVEDATGQVGLVGVAFGPEAQPEKLTENGMSAVNLGDFDTSLIWNPQIVLHRAYRYGAEGGELVVRVAPVESEVRVASKQVLSLGDERVVLSVNFTAEISRSGLFQLSFLLPSGLEVESLSGAALHHWAELTEADTRKIILHLNGKTIGTQNFALTLSGAAPPDAGDWAIPRFELAEATRQTGDLVVKPTTGIRLRTVSRQNVSETDPRTLGGAAQGALAFRLLQRDWNLLLAVEKLDPWVTGQVLHEVTLREGQTRTAIIGHFNVENSSIRTLQIAMPLTDEDEIKTLRAIGDTVSDFVRTAADSNVWEVQFKRRVVGKVDFRIEYERRGDRENDNETLSPVQFPQARQLAYYVAVRAGGRLELEHDTPPSGWQRVDWSTVPAALRESENRSAPAFALRAVTPIDALVVHAKRHSLADALKLRVAEGLLTTVLSSTGDQLTAVDVSVEVIQRSSLSVRLPKGGELFSIFVNGESVNSIRLAGDSNTWQFYILPGINDRIAKVRFVYSVAGSELNRLNLVSPELNVPLENILWNVIAPKGFELVDNDGNLELTRESLQGVYDRLSYLSKSSGKRQIQAKQAAQLLEQANQFLQAGEQSKASWALNSVANQYALDAASNEDARVQLENLQTQQAIVGLNTRRQRLYLDNSRDDTALVENKQFREAAADNPILQQDQMNFRPQELSQLLRGNTTEDNAVLQQIAARLVQQQRSTVPAPQAILISLPEEGSVYTFSRTVQVAENAPLELNLNFASQLRLRVWQTVLVLTLLAAFAATLAFASTRREVV